MWGGDDDEELSFLTTFRSRSRARLGGIFSLLDSREVSKQHAERWFVEGMGHTCYAVERLRGCQRVVVRTFVGEIWLILPQLTSETSSGTGVVYIVKFPTSLPRLI